MGTTNTKPNIIVEKLMWGDSKVKIQNSKTDTEPK